MSISNFQAFFVYFLLMEAYFTQQKGQGLALPLKREWILLFDFHQFQVIKPDRPCGTEEVETQIGKNSFVLFGSGEDPPLTGPGHVTGVPVAGIPHI